MNLKSHRMFVLIVMVILLVMGLLWYQLNWNRKVNGETLGYWHQIRVDGFSTLRKELRPVSEMAKGDLPFDAAKVEEQSMQVFAIAQTLPSRFIANAPSGDALPGIWAKGSDFNERLARFVEQTQALSEKPPSDYQQLRLAIDQLQTHCSECHKLYRD